jgi:hypothetical protein
MGGTENHLRYSIGFRDQQERNMSAEVPDQLVHEPVGVLIDNSAERIAVEERQNASRQYRAEGYCASSKREWERQYGKD